MRTFASLRCPLTQSVLTSTLSLIFPSLENSPRCYAITAKMATRLTTILVAVIVGATFIAGLIVGAQRDDASGPVDLIIVNGKVYPGGGADLQEAVAVRGNQILRVGSNRAVKRLRRAQTLVHERRATADSP